jgi:hypothetical protein
MFRERFVERVSAAISISSTSIQRHRLAVRAFFCLMCRSPLVGQDLSWRAPFPGQVLAYRCASSHNPSLSWISRPKLLLVCPKRDSTDTRLGQPSHNQSMPKSSIPAKGSSECHRVSHVRYRAPHGSLVR